MTLLKVVGLRGGYGEVDILTGVDLDVGEREIVTIAGTNGAGKSTLIKGIMGLLPRVSGHVELLDIEILGDEAEARLGRGISYVPQVANVFPSLTIKENLLVVEGIPDRRQRVEEMLELFPKLRQRIGMRAGALSGGERQQLAFARALMTRPRLMLLDEPTAALSPGLADQVFELIAGMPGRGVACLVVEQQARRSLEVSDRGYIMDGGRVVMAGPAAALLSDARMAELYLGSGRKSDISAEFPKAALHQSVPFVQRVMPPAVDDSGLAKLNTSSSNGDFAIGWSDAGVGARTSLPSEVKPGRTIGARISGSRLGGWLARGR